MRPCTLVWDEILIYGTWPESTKQHRTAWVYERAISILGENN